MKKSLAILALVPALMVGAAWSAQQGRTRVNKDCPVKPGSPATSTLVVQYNGKIVGLCCEDCIAKWKRNPGAYAGAVKEDFDPFAPPQGMNNAKAAMDAGKAGPYPVVIVFADESKGTKYLYAALNDGLVMQELVNCAFANVKFEKSDPLAKQLKVTKAPALVVVDPRGDEPKVVKKLTKAAPAQLAELLKQTFATVTQ